jgi:hypothetical protein
MLASSKLFYYLFIVFVSVLVLFYNCNIAYCADQIENNPEVLNPILDTSITVQTTPRQLGKLVGSLGLSGATLYGAYAGARMLPYLNTVYAGSALAKGTLGLSLIVTGGLFGLGTHIIGQRLGPRGPYFNVTIGQPAVDVNQNTTTTNNAIQSATVDCPLEVGEVVFNPFYNIVPLSDNPDLALLSVSILMLIFGIQCFNFILIRTIIIRNSSKILLYLKDYPSIYKVIETIILVLEKTYKFYVYGFSILGYFNLISATIFLLFLLNFLTQSS